MIFPNLHLEFVLLKLYVLPGSLKSLGHNVVKIDCNGENQIVREGDNSTSE